MRQHCYLLAAATFALTVSVAHAAGLVALSRAQWPLYYEGGAGGHLEIEIAEKTGGTTRAPVRYDGFLANVTITEGFGKDGVTVQEVVVRYVEQTLKGNYDEALRFYAPGTDSARAIAETRDLHERLDGLAEIEFLSEWFFMSSRFVLAEFKFDEGASHVMGFGFRNTPQGFLLSHETTDDEGIVLAALDYVADGIRQKRRDDHTVHPGAYAIPLGQGVFGLALKVDGRLHGRHDDWIAPSPDTKIDGPSAFAELAMATTASTDGSGVAQLWCPKDLARLAEAAVQDRDALARAKQSHVAGGRIKHVLTVTFGEDFVHYFVAESDPTGIRSLFVGTEGDGFCLSPGPGDRRVRRLLQSDVVKDGVWQLWVAQRAS